MTVVLLDEEHNIDQSLSPSDRGLKEKAIDKAGKEHLPQLFDEFQSMFYDDPGDVHSQRLTSKRARYRCAAIALAEAG